MKKKYLVPLFLFISFCSFSAHASITLLGGLNFSSPKYSNTGTPFALTPKSGLGFAAFIDKGFTPFFAIETGVMYLEERTKITALGFAGTFEMNRIHVPLMFRLKILPIISVGAGVYYETGLGNTIISFTEPAVDTAIQSYADAGLKKSEYGADFDLRFRFPVTPGFGLVLDGRYQLSFVERSTDSTTSFKNRAITALGGVSFGF